MFARFSTFKGGLERLEEGLELVRDTVVPADAEQPGFVGAQVLVDREAEVAHVVTFWETEAAMQATYQLSRELAEEGARRLDLQVSVRYFEVPLSTFPVPVR